MHPFNVAADGKLYNIECNIVIYRAKLGKHPDFLNKYAGDSNTGFNTKFTLLIENDINNRAYAESKAAALNAQYETLIRNCEETGNWDAFPFKNCEIIYYK